MLSKYRHLIAIAVSIGLVLSAIWIADIDDVLGTLVRFPISIVMAILGLFVLNLMVVSFRLQRLLSHFGVVISAKAVSRASISGHVSGLIMTSIFGQVIGRHVALRQFNISPMLIASITTYERMVLLLVGGSLCLTGALHLGAETALLSFLRQIPYLEMVIVVSTVLVATILLGGSRMDQRIRKSILSWRGPRSVVENVAISLAAQALVLCAFSIGALAIEPGMEVANVVAAAAIVSFAASIPLTINGWGVRELASIYTFGQIGLSSSSAVALSVLVGLSSTAIILAFAPMAIDRRQSHLGGDLPATTAAVHSVPARQMNLVEKYASYLFALLTSVFIMFQLHVKFNVDPNAPQYDDPFAGSLTINLADPLALVAFAAMIAHVASKRRLPQWRVPHLSLFLIGIGFLMAFGFVRGWLEIGITQWALMSRLFGWLVLLGYVSVGYLLVAYNGRHTVRRAVETMIFTAVATVLLLSIFRFLHTLGIEIGVASGWNFEGFAGNRNAFAFQLLTCLALLLGYSAVYSRSMVGTIVDDADSGLRALLQTYRRLLSSRVVFVAFGLGVLLVGIILTGSRAGMGTAFVVVAVAWAWRLAARRVVELSAVIGLIYWGTPILLLSLINALPLGRYGLGTSGGGPVPFQSSLSGSTSQTERWESITRAFDYWLESPILGKGLGYFVHHSTNFYPKPLLIHNTPMWLLTEFGIVGLAAVLAAFAVVFVATAQRRVLDAGAKGMLLLLIVVAPFCMVHDIFYQRIFWFTLALCTAGTFSLDVLRTTTGKVVCHVITGLGAGGAERMLTRLMSGRTPSGCRQFVVSLTDEGVFGRSLRHQGVTVYTLGLQRNFPSPSKIFTVLRVIWREKPDVVVTWLYHSDAVGLLAGWLLGVRRVIWNLRCSNMTASYQSLSARLLMWLLAKTSRMPECVIVNSVAGQQHHASIGYHPKAWWIISNGVDCAQFRPDPEARRRVRHELGVPEEAFVIGHVARFHPMKDYETLLDAIDRALAAAPSCHFVLVGSDVDRDNPFFAARCSSAAAPDRVHLLGRRTDIPAVMASFDALVLSSAYGEGAPNVIIEAMACGVPCVVTDVGDAAAIVDGVGKSTPPRDSAALAEAMLAVMSMPSEAMQAWREAARERAMRDFDIAEVNRRYNKVLLTEGQVMK